MWRLTIRNTRLAPTPRARRVRVRAIARWHGRDANSGPVEIRAQSRGSATALERRHRGRGLAPRHPPSRLTSRIAAQERAWCGSARQPLGAGRWPRGNSDRAASCAGCRAVRLAMGRRASGTVRWASRASGIASRAASLHRTGGPCAWGRPATQRSSPPPPWLLDGADNRLSTIVHRDVLDADGLLPGLPAMAVHRFHQGRERPAKAVRLGQALAPRFERLMFQVRTTLRAREHAPRAHDPFGRARPFPARNPTYPT